MRVEKELKLAEGRQSSVDKTDFPQERLRSDWPKKPPRRMPTKFTSTTADPGRLADLSVKRI